MSGGRVEFGIGAGWFEAEHRAYAIPFPGLGERFDRLEEQLDIITGMWATPVGEAFNYVGTHYTVTDSPALPKPVQQPHPPIIIGGGGAKRTPALAARCADEFNLAFPALEFVPIQFGRVRSALETAGRGTADMVFSAAFAVCAGRDDAQVARRAQAIGRDVDELRANTPLAGTPDEIVDRLGKFAEAGVQRVYLQLLDVADLDHLEFFAATVMRQIHHPG
jgi:alkanesulfonate monooxygenase SsuD/methylene tetrahydromethanopterin reductase-like flavin-dependent oxidoreductase (luciferase family)